MTQPRIFVGTMSSGEAEFAESQDSVFTQRDVAITYFLISNEPEWEAHNVLWSSWNAAKDSHDLFIKVDADTILNRDTLFREIADTMLTNPKITGAQIPLFDHFTQELILGLNCFTPQVIFTPSRSKLYCDRVDTNHDIVLRNDAVKHLSPAGWHCKNPHPKQAFHFGLHRMHKNQTDKILQIYNVWCSENRPYDARCFALLGAAWSVHGSDSDKFNYTDHEFNENFEASELLIKNNLASTMIENFIKKVKR